jgi:hypothetical protein
MTRAAVKDRQNTQTLHPNFSARNHPGFCLRSGQVHGPDRDGFSDGGDRSLRKLGDVRR